jgi:peptidoglycan pentaglycine glycine transferase (the first glycine)
MSRVTNPFRIIQNPKATDWDDFVSSREGHILQSSAWGELKSRFGWSAFRVALAEGDVVIAGAQILFRRLAPMLTLAYIPRGPVVDADDHNTVTLLFDALCAAAKSRGAFTLTIEPNVSADIAPSWLMTRDWRLAAGFQPRTTMHVDLTPGLDTLLAKMKPKWRYNIRLAERKGVTVRAGGAADLPTFYRLMQITGERDGFAIHSAEYYRTAFELLVTQDKAQLFIAEYEREPLAAIFVTTFGGEAIYLYGASGNAHRDRMPNYALHWAAMQWARACGCARYDLWGVPDEGPKTEDGGNEPSSVPRSGHPSALPDGLYQFKQGFGGEVVRYAEARDIVFSRWRYAAYTRAMAW